MPNVAARRKAIKVYEVSPLKLLGKMVGCISCLTRLTPSLLTGAARHGIHIAKAHKDSIAFFVLDLPKDWPIMPIFHVSSLKKFEEDKNPERLQVLRSDPLLVR